MNVLAIAAVESDQRSGRAASPNKGSVLDALAGAEGDIDGGLRRILLSMASIGFAILDHPEDARPMVAALAAADAPPIDTRSRVRGRCDREPTDETTWSGRGCIVRRSIPRQAVRVDSARQTTFSRVAIIGSMLMRTRDTPNHIARDARHPGARR